MLQKKSSTTILYELSNKERSKPSMAIHACILLGSIFNKGTQS